MWPVHVPLTLAAYVASLFTCTPFASTLTVGAPLPALILRRTFGLPLGSSSPVEIRCCTAPLAAFLMAAFLEVKGSVAEPKGEGQEGMVQVAAKWRPRPYSV